MKKIIIGFICCLFILSSCSTFVEINSEPENAKVTINDIYIGETPVTVVLSNLVTKEYYLTLSKNGYRSVVKQLEKAPKIGPILAGIFFTPIPLLWCYGPKNYYKFQLHKEENISFLDNENKDYSIYIDNIIYPTGNFKITSGQHQVVFIKDAKIYKEFSVEFLTEYQYKIF